MGNTAEENTLTTPPEKVSGWKKASAVVKMVQASQVDNYIT